MNCQRSIVVVAPYVSLTGYAAGVPAAAHRGARGSARLLFRTRDAKLSIA